MSKLVTILKWPVISLLITGVVHFVVEAIWPEARNIFTVPALAPLLLAYGLWIGHESIKNGGNYLTAVVAAFLLGLLPLLLETFGFGEILGFPGRALVGLFAFSMILFGSLIGSGFAISEKEKAL